MPQHASGRSAPAQGGSVFHADFRNFVAGADVFRQRQDAYGHEYAEVSLKGTQQAICCPAGGALHQPDGTLVPVAPWDWVVELPDGTLGSLSAEQVADSMEFVDGPDEQREMFEQTVKQVENARNRKRRENPPIKVDHEADRRPHPDGGEAAQIEFNEREKANLRADMIRQAQEAREQLQQVIDVAKKRKLIDPAEGKDWLDSGFAPDGVSVSFNQALGSWEVTRAAAPTEDNDAGTTETTTEGEPAKEEPKAAA
jgi:hypothetical protein